MRLAVSFLVVLLTSLFIAQDASARTYNSSFRDELTLRLPERIVLDAMIKNQVTITSSANGKSRMVFRASFHGSGIGASGTEYVANGLEVFTITSQPGKSTTLTGDYVIISKGATPDFILRVEFVLSTNAKGQPSVEVTGYGARPRR